MAPRRRSERSTRKPNGCYVGCVCTPCLAEDARMTVSEYRTWVRDLRSRHLAEREFRARRLAQQPRS